jgi:hypothetical protein
MTSPATREGTREGLRLLRHGDLDHRDPSRPKDAQCSCRGPVRVAAGIATEDLQDEGVSRSTAGADDIPPSPHLLAPSIDQSPGAALTPGHDGGGAAHTGPTESVSSRGSAARLRPVAF